MDASPPWEKRSRKSGAPASEDDDGDDDIDFKPASILSAIVLRIGSWEFRASKDEELQAKFFYNTKKLAWEIERDGFKEKISIDMCDITAIRAHFHENTPSILKLEMRQPPKFFKESDYSPERHPKWTDGSDFTDGQAYAALTHFALFLPGVLDEHYRKLLENDDRLFQLDRASSPSSSSSPSAMVAVNNGEEAAQNLYGSPNNLQNQIPYYSSSIQNRHDQIEVADNNGEMVNNNLRCNNPTSRVYQNNGFNGDGVGVGVGVGGHRRPARTMIVQYSNGQLVKFVMDQNGIYRLQTPLP